MKELPNYEYNERPWGVPERFTANEVTTVKILHVHPHKRFSLQKHAHRTEYWRVIAGNGTVTLDGEEREVTIGDDITIPPGTTHRLSGGPDGVKVLEIITGPYDENDIERLEDDFGRT